MWKPTDVNAIISIAKFIKELSNRGYAISFDVDEDSIYFKMHNNTNNMIYSLNIESEDGYRFLIDKYIKPHGDLCEKIFKIEKNIICLVLKSNNKDYDVVDPNNIIMKFIIDDKTYYVDVPIKEYIENSQLSLSI